MKKEELLEEKEALMAELEFTNIRIQALEEKLKERYTDEVEKTIKQLKENKERLLEKINRIDEELTL